MKAKVVIIGGGVMGVAIAWQVAQRLDPIAEPVVLLEKKALAAGSSGRSGAVLRQHYSDRVVAAMARDSLKVYAALERNTGRSIAFQKTGVLTIAGPERPEFIDIVLRNIAMQIEIGIDTRRVDAAEMRALVPGLVVDERAIGAFEPGAGGVDPLRTVEVFAALAREHGAITRIGTSAERLIVHGGRVFGVETSDGIIEAEQVVVATGPWTRNWLLREGIDLPLRVVRPEQHFVAMPNTPSPDTSSLATSSPDIPSKMARRAQAAHGPGQDPLARFAAHESELPRASHPIVLDLERGFYTRCDAHTARTRIGAMDYSQDESIEDPDTYDETVSDAFKRWARTSLEERLPIYRESPDVDSFAGLYTLSPDAQALIGPLRQVRGLFVVSGFSGHGFKLAPSIGEGVAQLLAGEPVSAFDPEFFAPDRFERKGDDRFGGAFGL